MPAQWFSILAGVWLAWALLLRLLEHNPRGDALTGLFFYANRLYCTYFHRLQVVGAAHLPTTAHPGSLIVVCNHTAGVDPLLVQAALPFEVRWMMGADMMTPRLDAFWRWARIIAVNRLGRDLGGTREALRHLAEGGHGRPGGAGGGALGVFPEGGLERPAGRLRRFHSGVGFLVARTGAPVLPIWISGTPRVHHAWDSLWRRGRARLTVGPVMRFAEGTPPDTIVAELQGWFERTSGWATGPVEHAA